MRLYGRSLSMHSGEFRRHTIGPRPRSTLSLWIAVSHRISPATMQPGRTPPPAICTEFQERISGNLNVFKREGNVGINDDMWILAVVG